MLEIDSDALESDLAETYHILEYRELPLRKVALFSVQLKEDSRIKMKLCGVNHPIERILLAHCVDYLALLLWSKTKDGEKGINRPKSVVKEMMAVIEEDNIATFESGEDFEEARRKILKEGWD